MTNYITSGSLTNYQLSGNYLTNSSLFQLSGNYLTNASLFQLSGNYLTNASLFQLSGNYITSDSPIFTGTPKLTIGGLNYDLTTQPWVGGWLQFGTMTVQKQNGSNNFSVVRSAGYAAGSFDISFPAHPAGGSYMIIFTPRLSSGAPVLYGYGGVINATGFTVRFTNIGGTNIDAEFSLCIPRN